MAIEWRHAPIVGEEGCVRLSGDGHFSLPADDAGWPSGDGFSFLIDLQADLASEQTVFGAREADGTAIVLRQHAGGALNHVGLEVADSAGGVIAATFRLSDAHGKRLVCNVDPRRGEAEMYELQQWGLDRAAEVTYEQRRPLNALAPMQGPIFLSGARERNEQRGSFTGRVANLAIFGDKRDAASIEALRSASMERSSADVPRLDPNALNDDGRELLLDDYRKLAELARATSIGASDTREASVVAYRWLCDRTPLLVRASNALGIQLSFPDLDPMRGYTSKVKELRPVFLYHRDRWEGGWLPRSAFLEDMAFWIGTDSKSVSWEAFIRFVRNKMGGGHYDPDDRKRWHDALESMIKETKVGGDRWIDVKMQVLAAALAFTVESCGVIALIESLAST
jgi:hypothetical protein